ncbi:MAG: Ig-like domain-containing protein [Prolixibacteraceae bacterium]|nr:Ig-like domain-containing protein [Prolixibacteraceae bacterium]
MNTSKSNIFSKSAFLTLFTFCCFFAYSQDSGDCEKCGKRLVTCWDLDILTPKPTNPEDSILWKQLHNASSAYYGNLVAKESPKCLALLPGCRIGDPTPPWKNPCPYKGQANRGYDYAILGEIRGKEGAYSLRLILVTNEHETVSEATVSFEKAAEAGMFGVFATLELGGTSSGSRMLYDVIHEYEVKKRDKSNDEKFGNVAIEPKIEFDQSSYKVRFKSTTDRSQKMVITLTDCDGVVLKNRNVSFWVKEGALSSEKVMTDENGKAEVTYITTQENYSDVITAEWDYYHPNDKKGTVRTSAPVQILPPVEFLDGYITVGIENSKFSPNKKNQIQSELVSRSISGKITLRIIRDRIQRYIDKPDFRRECDPTTHCPILSGGSDFQARDPLDYSIVLIKNRYPLIVRTIINEMGIRGVDGKEKYVNTYNSAADDTNSVEGLNLEIKAYVAGEGQLAPLSPYYVIWLTGGKYLDKLRIQPFGRGGAMQWDIYKEKLVPISDPVGVGIPYVIAEPEADMTLYKTYEPLLIKNSVDFERYLMNPAGSFKIYASGNQTQENESFTSESQVTVTISLSPHEIPNQPKK